MRMFPIVVLAALGAAAASVEAVTVRGFEVSVLVADTPRPEYPARGTVYIEAVRGSEYALRLVNPLDRRVAVALAVDGLNTIDARHSTAREAAKWVLDPGASVVIEGWQVSDREARRFTFTGERSSYGAWLGRTADLGVIEAAFFAERRPIVVRDRSMAETAPGASAGQASKAAPLSDEHAATGAGARTDNPVERVWLDLEDTPSAVVRIRYEFREGLERLGVLRHLPDPLLRREGARGFPGPFCPDPPGR